MMISQSRKVLVLLSKSYINNGWCREEFDHACRHVQQHNEKDLVIVLLHDPNVHKVMDKLMSSAKLKPSNNNNGVLPTVSKQVSFDRSDLPSANHADTLVHSLAERAGNHHHHNVAPIISTVSAKTADANIAITHVDMTAHLGGESDHDDHHDDHPERRGSHEYLTPDVAEIQRRKVQRKGSKRKRLSKREAKEAQRLEDLCRFNDCGQEVVLEPLCSYLLEGRYVELSDWLFQHKLLFELSRQRKEKRVADENV
jgi:hypothetical protein